MNTRAGVQGDVGPRGAFRFQDGGTSSLCGFVSVHQQERAHPGFGASTWIPLPRGPDAPLHSWSPPLMVGGGRLYGGARYEGYAF